MIWVEGVGGTQRRRYLQLKSKGVLDVGISSEVLGE